jgi:PhnB protein
MSIKTTITPWLSFSDCAKAVAFYKMAFDAEETYKLESPDGGLVVRLSVQGAEFWLSSGDDSSTSSAPVGGDTVRLILTVTNPDPIFEKAIQCGAKEIFPVGTDHGWRLGRLADPFGLHWEIGHPVEE